MKEMTKQNGFTRSQVKGKIKYREVRSLEVFYPQGKLAPSFWQPYGDWGKKSQIQAETRE